MKIQTDSYSCGACAIMNAMEAIGRVVSVSEVERLAGTTPQGTDENGIKAALDALGVGSEVIHGSPAWPVSVSADWFWSSIWSGVSAGSPSVVYSRPRQHWFAVIGAVGPRLVAFDSDNTKVNIAASGVHVVDKAGLLAMTGDELYALRVLGARQVT